MSGQNGKELANKIRFQVLTTYEFVHQLKPYQKKREVEAGERMNNLMKRIFLPEQVKWCNMQLCYELVGYQ
jgi:hypothetical protein